MLRRFTLVIRRAIVYASSSFTEKIGRTREMSVRSTGERSKVKQSPGSVTMRAYWLVCGLPFLMSAQPPAEDKVKIVKLFEGPNYCEGVVFDHDGNGYILP